jgi:hypothetical protein
MHSNANFWRSRSSVLALALVAAVPSVLGSCCSTSPHSGAAAAVADVPKELAVTGPVIARVHATGFQVYTVQPDAAGKLAWKLKAPDATFHGDHGLSGKHYAGPTWESASDGSKVVGRKIAEHPAGTDAIPWLLLEAASHEGQGVLSSVTYVQRLNTTGGKAPAAVGAKAGDEARVPYTADYVFFGPGAKVISAAH